MRFVVATLHVAGLGFALRLQDEGHDVLLASAGTADRRLEDRYQLVGEGLVPKAPLTDVIPPRPLDFAQAFGEALPEGLRLRTEA